MTKRETRGFTLIELLVVVSIVSLISSVAMYSTAQARVKAEDAKKKSEVRQIETAIAIKKSATGRVPRNYNCSGTYCSGGTGTAVALEGTTAFNASMQELVNEGYLSSIPNSKDDSYVYYADSGASNAAFGASLNTGSVNSARNSCPSMPVSAPYSVCQGTWGTGNEPYYTSPDAVNFPYPQSMAFCSTYGSPSCNAGGNGQYANACPGGFLCITPAAYLTVSCLPNAGVVSTCVGGGNDFCACI